MVRTEIWPMKLNWLRKLFMERGKRKKASKVMCALLAFWRCHARWGSWKPRARKSKDPQEISLCTWSEVSIMSQRDLAEEAGNR